MSIPIRSYDPTADREAVFQLWETAFGTTWPLYAEGFYGKIDPQAEHHLVATMDGEIVGFIAVSRDSQQSGSVFAIVVRPDHWGAGIESTLLAAATQHFRKRGVTKLRFGGGRSYFWPGVPADQPDILELLERNGWRAGEQITDMVGNVEKSHVPEEVVGRIARSGAHLRLATSEDGPAITQFEEQHFPQWLATASRWVEQQDYANILLAQLDDEIVGTNFLSPAGSPDVLWSRLLGADCSAYGSIGVSEAVRGRYIGYALAVRAAEILTERGARKIFLSWVFSIEWYGRIDYEPWRTYQTMSKELASR